MKTNKPITFNKLLIAGAGTLGSKIAWQCAFHGYRTVVYDPIESSLTDCKAKHRKYSEHFRTERNASENEINEAFSRLSYTSELAIATNGVDFVSESIPEDLELKRQFFAQVSALVHPSTILTSNSSQLAPSDIAVSCKHPENFLFLHFLTGVWRPNLVEVMGHTNSKEELIDTLTRFSKTIGMVPVSIHTEVPGMILNSLLVPHLTAAWDCLLDGAADFKDIDRLWMHTTGMKIGPFGILDSIGMNTLYKGALSESDTPNRKAIYIKNNFIDRNLYGANEGEGFYTYPAPEFSLDAFCKDETAYQYEPKSLVFLEHSKPMPSIKFRANIIQRAQSAGHKIQVYCENKETLSKLEAEIDSLSSGLTSTNDRNICFNSLLETQFHSADVVFDSVTVHEGDNENLKRHIRKHLAPKAIMVGTSADIDVKKYAENLGSQSIYAICVPSSFVENLYVAELIFSDDVDGKTTSSLISIIKSFDIHPTVLKKHRFNLVIIRLIRPILFHACNLLAQKCASIEDIDKCWMITTNCNIGPLGIIDQIGIDHFHEVTCYFGSTYNDEFMLRISTFLKTNYIEKNLFGRSTSSGFYTYPNPSYGKIDFIS
ncbi:MAG: 3-hydroxybutyryl-CoA dehydrogenase [Flavobacteriales bacterium]|jgi:3-hydroxybutyryl-CoA dehydrogenase